MSLQLVIDNGICKPEWLKVRAHRLHSCTDIQFDGSLIGVINIANNIPPGLPNQFIHTNNLSQVGWVTFALSNLPGGLPGQVLNDNGVVNWDYLNPSNFDLANPLVTSYLTYNPFLNQWNFDSSLASSTSLIQNNVVNGFNYNSIPVNVVQFDNPIVDTTGGIITPSAFNSLYTINSAGLYKIEASLKCNIPNPSTLQFGIYVNSGLVQSAVIHPGSSECLVVYTNNLGIGDFIQVICNELIGLGLVTSPDKSSFISIQAL